MMKNKNILLGITASIAAYKAAELVRMYKKAGANVKTVVTENALLFIGEKTLETLSGNPVSFDMFQKRAETEHISLADWADVFVIAPISANSISKISSGIADNLLTSIACAYLGKNKPLLIAPAMNEGMWKNPVIQKNIEILKNSGARIIEPERGFLACGCEGIGRMREPEEIFTLTDNVFLPEMNKKIVVTAGGTREYIDPVRFISNSSSGKMGAAIADAAYQAGYDTVLITTKDYKKPYRTVFVNSADDMKTALDAEFKDADYLFMAAAVSDFKAKNFQNSKIKKTEINNIELVQNPDILKYIAANKRKGQKVIGFSLSTENAVENGKKKLKDKNCDFIIANEARTVLNKDDAEVWIINKEGKVKKIEKAPKREVARLILESVL